MSKFVIEPKQIYLVNYDSDVCFLRVIGSFDSDYVVNIGHYSDDSYDYDSDIIFGSCILTPLELVYIFGPFDFLSKLDEIYYDDSSGEFSESVLTKFY